MLEEGNPISSLPQTATAGHSGIVVLAQQRRERRSRE
jgi:hypothetical protein